VFRKWKAVEISDDAMHGEAMRSRLRTAFFNSAEREIYGHDFQPVTGEKDRVAPVASAEIASQSARRQLLSIIAQKVGRLRADERFARRMAALPTGSF
jgi:hypothetical protein